MFFNDQGPFCKGKYSLGPMCVIFTVILFTILSVEDENEETGGIPGSLEFQIHC